MESGLEGDSPAVIAPGFDEDALAYCDRVHQHNGVSFSRNKLTTSRGVVVPLPDYLVGGDHLRFANGASDNPSYRATVTADVASDFYLLIDNRIDGPTGTIDSSMFTEPVLGGTLQWVLDAGWERVNTGISPGGQADYTGLDEGGSSTIPGWGNEQFFSVYRLARRSTVTVHGIGVGDANMISLVVVPRDDAQELDLDEDGLPDSWETENFGSLAESGSGDFDGDGLTNLQESHAGTNPIETDSDHDGLSDGDEVNLFATDPVDPDSDDDSLSDGAEVSVYGSDPLDIDSDDDSLRDDEEVLFFLTDPNRPDTDDDGFNDAVEATGGFDPNDDQSIPNLSPLNDVIINEFMASNDSTLLDEDGDSSDWVELWNPDQAAVEVTGWYLSDDPLNLTKWRLPGGTLPPNGFLVVFASGKDRAIPGAEFHTNFQLSRKAGSFIALSRPDGLGGVEIVASFDPYGRQFEDVSYGFYGEAEPLPSGYF